MNFCIIESNFVIHEKNADLMCLSLIIQSFFWL